jgi:hypothetical protein
MKLKFTISPSRTRTRWMLTAAFVLLLVATPASHVVTLAVTWRDVKSHDDWRWFHVGAQRGRFVVNWQYWGPWNGFDEATVWLVPAATNWIPWWGCALRRGYGFLTFPLGVPLAGLALPVVLSWRRSLGERRAVATNPCSSCGYSLAGLIAGAACPECGAVAGALRP